MRSYLLEDWFRGGDEFFFQSLKCQNTGIEKQNEFHWSNTQKTKFWC